MNGSTPTAGGGIEFQPPHGVWVEILRSKVVLTPRAHARGKAALGCARRLALEPPRAPQGD